MPRRSSSAARTSSAGEDLGLLPLRHRWEMLRRWGSGSCCLNKLGLWWIRLLLLVSSSSCCGRGARLQRMEEIGGGVLVHFGHSFSCRARPYASCGCSSLELSLSGSPWWRLQRGKISEGGFLTNKLDGFCRSSCGGSATFLPLAGRGGEGVEDACAAAGFGRRLRSLEAAPGSESMAVDLWPPSLMVEGRLLPPSPPVTALSGRRQTVNINLQAVVPIWRPFCSGAVGSRRLAPSGLVPGGVASGCAVACRCGGDGAGPDGFSFSSSRVRGANCLDLAVIFNFLESFMYGGAAAINISF